jgi:cytochrome c oxidase assembly factor CtaG
MEIERGMREVWCSAFGWRRFRARIPAAWTLGIALRCKVENSTVSVRATSQNTNMSAYSYTAATCQNCCGNITIVLVLLLILLTLVLLTDWWRCEEQKAKIQGDAPG